MSIPTRPRFERVSARGRSHDLESPLPPVVAQLPSLRERAKGHERLAATLSDLRAKVVELGRALVEAEDADEREATQAAIEGRRRAKAMKSSAVRKKLEDAEDERLSFERALLKSADDLLAIAAPHFVAAADLAATERERAFERAGQHLEALDQALAEAARLEGELGWLLSANGQARLVPYREHLDPRVFQLRGLLRGALEQFLARRAEEEAERERLAAYEREHEDEWRRQAEAAEAQQAAQRIVVEDGRIVERGGRPVGPQGFQLPEEEES
jgi:septal ring factor EnvC (AmiA/AmiB activator)